MSAFLEHKLFAVFGNNCPGPVSVIARRADTQVPESTLLHATKNIPPVISGGCTQLQAGSQLLYYSRIAFLGHYGRKDLCSATGTSSVKILAGLTLQG